MNTNSVAGRALQTTRNLHDFKSRTRGQDAQDGNTSHILLSSLVRVCRRVVRGFIPSSIAMAEWAARAGATGPVGTHACACCQDTTTLLRIAQERRCRTA